MNERIQQLAEQAGMTDDKFGMFFAKDNHNEDGVDLEKFTQLLVEEFEKVAKNPQWYSESASNGWRNPIRHVCNAMKQHFGVE